MGKPIYSPTAPGFNRTAPCDFGDMEWIHTYWLLISYPYTPWWFSQEGFSVLALGQSEIQEDPLISIDPTAIGRGGQD